ncbi:MAG: proline dehydrogenase family protein [Akkermansia sp.]
MASASLNRWMDESRKHGWDRHKIATKSVELAGGLLMESQRFSKGNDKHIQALLSAFAKDATTRQFVQGLLQDVFSTAAPQAAEQRLAALMSQSRGIPAAFGRLASLKVSFLSFSSKGKVDSMRSILYDTAGAFLLPAEGDGLAKRLRDDKNDCSQSSIRFLTSPIMGKSSVKAYVASALEYLKHPAAFALELDLNALCAQSNFYHFEQSTQRLKTLLAPVLKASVQSAVKHPIVLSQGGSQSLPIAVAAIKDLLEDKAFDQIDLCLELPAYLPIVDSLLADLSAWASKRCEKTTSNKVFRSALKLRLVKGESLAKEQLTALRNRRQESLSASKMETDARYKVLMMEALQCQGLDPIFATHNIFDVAYALLTWARARRTGVPRFSFLRGISMPLVRCLLSHGFDVQLESCLFTKTDELAAHQLLLDLIEDLERSQSVLCLAPSSNSESVEWIDLAQKFSMSSTKMEGLSEDSPAIAPAWLSSINIPQQRECLESALQAELAAVVEPIIPKYRGKAIKSSITVHVPQLYRKAVDYTYDSMMHDHTARLLNNAKEAQEKIESSLTKRCEVVTQLCIQLEQQRAQLMAKLVRYAGFSMADADFELGQAIAFCRYYAETIQDSSWRDGSKVAQLGIAVVAPSHQSPLADAVEGIITAWIAGSCVIYQAATNAIPVGIALHQCLLDAGMKSPYLQLAICLDNQIAESLVMDEDVALTACYAPRFVCDSSLTPPLSQLELRKPKQLCSVLIAADADWRRAILESLHSFTQRAGQLASTPHALIVEATLYDSPEFQEGLRDAFSSIELGDCRYLMGDFGPQCAVLKPETVARLCTLNKGENWLVGAPQAEHYATALCAPILRIGVSLDSPVLQWDDAACLPHMSVLRARDAAEALEIQANISKHYRGGIYTKDDSLIERWRKYVPMAHAFINSPPVACLPALLSDATMNQSWAASGGASFVASICSWKGHSRPQRRSQMCQIPFTPWEMIHPRPTGDAMMRLRAAADSISLWWESEFGIRHRLSDTAGEWTELRYDSVPICIRAEKDMSDVDLCILLMVGLKAGSGVELSMSDKRNWAEGRLEPLGVKLTIESRKKYEERLPSIAKGVNRLRDIAATETTRQIAKAAGLSLSTEPIMANGRIELLRVCRERSVTCCER